MITVQVNGEKRQLAASSNVADLLTSLGLGGRRVAVERNRELVRRETYEQTPVENGDVFEIIEFVGGGA